MPSRILLIFPIGLQPLVISIADKEFNHTFLAVFCDHFTLNGVIVRMSTCMTVSIVKQSGSLEPSWK